MILPSPPSTLPDQIKNLNSSSFQRLKLSLNYAISFARPRFIPEEAILEGSPHKPLDPNILNKELLSRFAEKFDNKTLPKEDRYSCPLIAGQFLELYIAVVNLSPTDYMGNLSSIHSFLSTLVSLGASLKHDTALNLAYFAVSTNLGYTLSSRDLPPKNTAPKSSL